MIDLDTDDSVFSDLSDLTKKRPVVPPQPGGADQVVSYQGAIPQYGQIPDTDEADQRVTVGQRVAGVIKPPTRAPEPEAPQVRVPFNPRLLPEAVRPRTIPAPDEIARPEAKLLRDILIDAIERYELANGELKWPKLPGQNIRESREQQFLASAPGGKAN